MWNKMPLTIIVHNSSIIGYMVLCHTRFQNVPATLTTAALQRYRNGMVMVTFICACWEAAGEPIW